MDRSPFLRRLATMLNPNSVAVVGASDDFGKLGYHVMKSLIQGGFRGRVYPVNPRAKGIWGLRAFPSVKDLPKEVDLAVVAVPAPLVPGVLEECGEKGVKGVVLITAGFGEVQDPDGLKRQKELASVAERWGLPVIGPNTFGFVNLTEGVNASFTPEFSRIGPGGVALVSQSGGFCHLSGFLALRQGMGLSKIVGLGNRLNVDFPEMVDLFAEDPSVRVMALYIEGMERPRELMESCRSLGAKKPVLVYKAARGRKGDPASRLHTGSLAGDYRIWRGLLRQAGVLEVHSTEELLDTARALEVLPPMRGPRVAVLSGQAGPGVIASDVSEALGLELASFSAQTHRKIEDLLPPVVMRSNPVDTGPAWYDPRAIVQILKVVLDDEAVDGVLFLNTFASANLGVAEAVRDFFKGFVPPKPVIGSFPAPSGVWEELREVDGKGGFVTFPTPERAARAMANLWRWEEIRRWVRGS